MWNTPANLMYNPDVYSDDEVVEENDDANRLK